LSISLALLIIRVVVGLTIAAHGAQKVFGWWGGSGIPGWAGALTKMRIRPALPWAVASAGAELLGGVGLALGLLSPLPSFAIAGSMLVAITLVHLPHGFWSTKGGYEFNLTILAAVAAVALAGPGRYSLDNVLGIHLPEPWTLIVMTVLTIGGVAFALLTRSPQEAAAQTPQTT
jgi:putative oxidoreductase